MMHPHDSSRGSVPSPVVGVVALLLVALAFFPAAQVQYDGGATSSASPTPSRITSTTSDGGSGSAGKLSWAPPTLSDPLVVKVTADNRSIQIPSGRDARIVLPTTEVDLGGGIAISGGRNVVIMGGVIHIADDVTDEQDRRGLYLVDQTGTVHVEGVAFTGHLSDGINLAESEGATVQLQNILVEHVYGGYDTNHADVIQTWAGPSKLLVDGLRATTDYQGFFLLPNQHFDGAAPESFVFRRTLLTMTEGSAYALWLPDEHPWADVDGLDLYFSGEHGTDKYIWPNSSASSLGVTLLNSASAASMPSGTPGGSYQSPGYR